MTPDWDDPLDPLNPVAPFYWSDWVCPHCAEDGEASELGADRRCPHCGSEVAMLE